MATVGKHIFPPKFLSSSSIFKPSLSFSDAIKGSVQFLPKPPPFNNHRTPTPLAPSRHRLRSNRSEISRYPITVGRCFRCCREGHHAKTCRLPVACHACGEAGHLKFNCNKARNRFLPDLIRENPGEGIKQELVFFLKALEKLLPSCSDPKHTEKLEANLHSADKDGDLVDFSLALLYENHPPAQIQNTFDVMSLDPDVVGAKNCEEEMRTGSDEVIASEVQQGDNYPSDGCPPVSVEVEGATDLTLIFEEATLSHSDSTVSIPDADAIPLDLTPEYPFGIFNLTIIDDIAPRSTEDYCFQSVDVTDRAAPAKAQGVSELSPSKPATIRNGVGETKGSNEPASSVKIRRNPRLRRGWL